MAPQWSCVRMLRAQTPGLIRANYCGDPTRHLVDPSSPRHRPRRVRDPLEMTMRNSLHGFKLTRCVPCINSILFCDSNLAILPNGYHKWFFHLAATVWRLRLVKYY